MNNQNKNQTLLVAAFIVGTGLLRLLLTGWLPNISPVAAMALFGGVYFRDKRIAFALPLLIMFFTDVALEFAHQVGWREYAGFHSTMPFVYMGFLMTVVIGIFFRDNVKPLHLAGASLLSSTVFFLVTNFGVWIAGGYPQTPDGLITCYVAAIPFFQYTIAGDLFFVGVLFAGYEFAKKKFFSASAA